ncbi:MAG: pseudaminic acid synthase [Ruminococcaceae bacterium]|nr:pseudaminic acid synthase [Oscillospiraceae bacterium]
MNHMWEKVTNGEVYTIAEMSGNHAGKLENALAIVRAAKEAGADCLKIQTYTADTITLDSDNECFFIHGGTWDGYRLYELYQDAGTPLEWNKIIKEECEKVGIDFLSTPFDTTAVDLLEEIGTEIYKIASPELIDIPLIEYVASKGKPMLISCGMGSEEEIREAVDACHRMGNDRVILLKCCSDYPAQYDEMNLNAIPDMQKKFGVKVGLSDHSMGSLADVVAVALGGCVIEKHMCLSREIENPDSSFSMEPQEFAKMVEDVKNASKTLGQAQYKLSEGEQRSRLFRKSIFIAEDVEEGTVLDEKNLRVVRPSNGLHPRYYKELLGKKVTRKLTKGTPFEWNMIETKN